MCELIYFLYLTQLVFCEVKLNEELTGQASDQMIDPKGIRRLSDF